MEIIISEGRKVERRKHHLLVGVGEVIKNTGKEKHLIIMLQDGVGQKKGNVIRE